MFHSIIQSTTAARVVSRHVMLNMTELLPLAICHVWDLWCFCSELSLTVFCRLLRQNCLCFVWPRSIKVRRPELATGHGLNNTCTTTNTSFCEAVCWYWIKGKAAFFFFFWHISQYNAIWCKPSTQSTASKMTTGLDQHLSGEVWTKKRTQRTSKKQSLPGDNCVVQLLLSLCPSSVV